MDALCHEFIGLNNILIHFHVLYMRNVIVFYLNLINYLRSQEALLLIKIKCEDFSNKGVNFV